MLKKLYPHLVKFDKKTFLTKRLPIYLIGIFILLVFGVKGLVITIFLCMAFVGGWFLHSAVQLWKDYRMSLALNRVHFSAADVTTMKKQLDLALTAVKAYQQSAGGGRGVKGPQMAPNPSASRVRYDSDQLQALIMQMESEKEEQ